MKKLIPTTHFFTHPCFLVIFPLIITNFISMEGNKNNHNQNNNNNTNNDNRDDKDHNNNESLSKNNKQHHLYYPSIIILLFTLLFGLLIYTKLSKPTTNTSNNNNQNSSSSDRSQSPQSPKDSTSTSPIITHEHIGEKVPPLTTLPEGYSLKYRDQDRYIIDKDGRYELKLDPDWSPVVYGNTIYYFIGEYLAYEGGGGYFTVTSFINNEDKNKAFKDWSTRLNIEDCSGDDFCSYLSETFYVDDIEARIYVTGERMGGFFDERLVFYKEGVLYAFISISVPKPELIKLIKNIKPL